MSWMILPYAHYKGLYNEFFLECKIYYFFVGSESQVQELSFAAVGYYRVVKENRNLYNMVQDLKGWCTFETQKLTICICLFFCCCCIWRDSFIFSIKVNLMINSWISGNIRVYCRIRPSLSYEAKTVIDFVGDNGSLVILDPLKPQKDGRKVFQFNRVFGPAATQGNITWDSSNLWLLH